MPVMVVSQMVASSCARLFEPGVLARMWVCTRHIEEKKTGKNGSRVVLAVRVQIQIS